MAFKKVAISNFKSFRHAEVELDRFNLVIGPNASGKSNFVQVFKFLRDIARSGLVNAVSMQGGVEYLRNMNIGADEDLVVTTVSDVMFGLVNIRRRREWLGLKIYETEYSFGLRFHKRGSGFKVVQDKLTQRCQVVRFSSKGRALEEREILGEGSITTFRSNGRADVEIDLTSEEKVTKYDLYPRFAFEQELGRQNLLLEDPLLFPPPLREVYADTSIYDFDPKLPKKATPITGKAELEEDASNLSIILKNVLESRDKRRKLLNLLSDLLPFVGSLDVVKFADKSLMFKLREVYFERRDLPASLISDGTINLTALIVALYFEEKPFVIIEEPERNIHPQLISRVVEMMKDASRNKQILATTHNPELVKHTGVQNLLLVSRDASGFSVISRPADAEQVQAFLRDEIGIEELFVQNLLSVN